TARAATPLQEISAAVAGRRQMLAFEPPDLSKITGSHSEGTLGGTLAGNLSGPRRLQAGAARDFILGFQAVSGLGEIFKAGGKVVKNVTGYDLPKLLCGSWGTLAVMFEVTIKVMPAPESETTVALSGLGHEAAVQAMRTALHLPVDVSAAAYLPNARSAGLSGAFVLLRIAGIAASVAARVETLKDAMAEGDNWHELDTPQSQAAWQAVRDLTPLLDYPQHLIWRVSVPPMVSPEVMRRLGRLPAIAYFCDWAGGLMWLAVPAAPHAHAEPVRATVAECGGHATLFRAPEAVRSAVPVFEPQPAALAGLTRRVKGAFDPRRILNRGRMYAGV
ncbi:MAG: FAD-binding protein, partial [Pseudomonadota bacterium]|nr:FAD-binding protein [Pseudomonadota bacterium]